jgi:hypothetical protein
MERTEALSQFFAKYKCPDINYTLIDDYLDAADKYNIDYRLLPAISLQESSCLKRYPPDTHNGWGWASARVGFATLPAGIDYITGQLANGKYYAGKAIAKKLNAYNPNPEYAPKILRFMAEIQKQ